MDIVTALMVMSEDLQAAPFSIAYAYSIVTKEFTVLIEREGHIFKSTDSNFMTAYTSALKAAKKSSE